MALNIDPKVVSLIVAAVEQHADGATLNDIIASFPEAPPRRSANRWVTGLAASGVLRADVSSMPHRYFVGSGMPDVADSGSTVANSADLANASPAVANSQPNVAKLAGAGPETLPEPANDLAKSSGVMANSDLAMAKSHPPSAAPVANSAGTVAKSESASPGSVAKSGDRAPASVANSPADLAKSPTSGLSAANAGCTVANSADLGNASPAVANSQPNVAKSAGAGPETLPEPANDLAKSSGVMANSDLAMAKSHPPSAAPVANSADTVAKSEGASPGSVAKSGDRAPASVANSPADLAKSQPSVANSADLANASPPVATSQPTVAKSAGVAKSAVAGDPVAKLMDPPSKSGRKRAKSAADTGPNVESTVADLAKSAIEAVMAPPSTATGVRRAEPPAGLVANSVAKSASQAVTNLLAKSVDPLIPANLRPLVRVAALIVGAVLAIGILTQASLHPWIVAGAAIAVIVGILIFAALRRPAASGAESTVAKSASVAKSVANSPERVAKSAIAAAPVANSASGATEGPTAGVPAADLDPDFSVPASQRFSVSGNAVPASSAARGWRVYILPGALTLLAAGIWIAWYLHYRHRPSEADVSAWLTKAVAPLPVRVAAIDLTYTSTGSVSCSAGYSARLQTTEPLFKAIDTKAYLQTHFPAEMSAIQTAATLLAGPNGARLRAAVAASSGGSVDLKPGAPASGPSSDFSVLGCQLVNVSAPPGTSRLISGSVEAWRDGKTWAFKDAPVSVSGLPGEPMSVLVAKAGGSAVLAVEFPEDEARLKLLVVEHAAYAAKVQAAATALAADLERERQQKAVELERARQQQAADLQRERQQKLTALNQLLQRGTWFSGVFVDLPKPDSHRVLLEVTDCSATTHEIILLARNDGGWFNTRPMTGTWAIGADGESCTASVRSNTFDAIQGAGFLIEEPHTTALTLKVRLDGSVSADPRNWNLQRIAPENVAATKAEFGFGRTVEPSTGRTAVAVAPTVGAGLPHAPGTDRPLDRSTVIPATVTPIDRSPVPSGAPQAPSLPANAVPALSPADLQFFSVAASPAAYVRVDGTWIRLPQNSAQAIQSVPQKLTGALAAVSRWEDKLAGKSSSTSSASEAGAIKFDGIETVPVAPANEVLIAYIGPLTPVSAEAKARYPELKDYPIIELAPERTAAKGVRYATLYRLPGGLLGFANTRVMTATIEQPAANVTLLRSTAPLRRGQYAVACGSQAYELAVE